MTANVAYKRPSKPQGTGQRRFSSFDKLRELADRDSGVIKRKPQPQPEPVVFNGPVNAWYVSERNGREIRIFLVEVKKDVVYFKDREEDKHSKNISLAKFVKYYKLA